MVQIQVVTVVIQMLIVRLSLEPVLKHQILQIKMETTQGGQDKNKDPLVKHNRILAMLNHQALICLKQQSGVDLILKI